MSNTSLLCGTGLNTSQQEENSTCASPPPFKHFYQYDEYNVYRVIRDNAVYVHTAPAIPLNLICVLVAAFMKPANTSRIFMLVLVSTDLLCVVCRLVYELVDLAVSVYLCKYITYINICLIVYSNYVLICFTLERVIVTSVPLKAGRVCTVRNTIIALIVALILSMALNSVYFKDSIIKQRPGATAAVCTLTLFAGNTWNKVYGFYHNIIPLILIILCNVVIVFNLVRARTRKKKLTNRTQATKQNDPTRTLLVLSIIFALLHAPYALFNFFVPDYPTREELPEFDQQLMARLLLAGNIVYNLMCFQNSLTLFLYCMTSSNFRAAFFAVTRPVRHRLSATLPCCRSGTGDRATAPRTTAPTPATNSSYLY